MEADIAVVSSGPYLRLTSGGTYEAWLLPSSAAVIIQRFFRSSANAPSLNDLVYFTAPPLEPPVKVRD